MSFAGVAQGLVPRGMSNVIQVMCHRCSYYTTADPPLSADVVWEHCPLTQAGSELRSLICREYVVLDHLSVVSLHGR